MPRGAASGSRDARCGARNGAISTHVQGPTSGGDKQEHIALLASVASRGRSERPLSLPHGTTPSSWNHGGVTPLAGEIPSFRGDGVLVCALPRLQHILRGYNRDFRPLLSHPIIALVKYEHVVLHVSIYAHPYTLQAWSQSSSVTAKGRFLTLDTFAEESIACPAQGPYLGSYP